MSVPDDRRTSFADNRRVTVADAIAAAFRYDDRWPLAVATAYFNLGGYLSIAEVIDGATSVRILLGAEPKPLVSPDTLHEAALERETEAIAEHVRAERDALPFHPGTEQGVHRLIALLAKPSTQIRIYRKGFVHGKAFVFGDRSAVIAGSANLTAAGMNHNLELDLGQYDPDKVGPVKAWFDELWDEADPFDLAAVFWPRIETYEPHLIYVRMLVALYGAEVGEVAAAPTVGGLLLAEFQRLGAHRAVRILDRWGGALLADGVGLGKTFAAGEVLRIFSQNRGLYVLLVCPASLRPMWEQFITRNKLAGQVISYQQLAKERRLGGDTEVLHLPPASYHLIVADEAHALRSPETQYYRALQRLLSLAPLAKLLLLTATPVNNSLWDLYHELMLFARNDAHFAELGIRSLREHFRAVANVGDDTLDPSHLFSLLDATSIRRTRRFVQQHFPDAVIQGAYGPIRIAFPSLLPIRPLRYDIDALSPGLFQGVRDAVDADDGRQTGLTMARYRPSAYALETAELPPEISIARAEVLAGLLRSQMLKRFESSAYAFSRTLGRMVGAIDAMLTALKQRGIVLLARLDEETSVDDLDVEQLLDEGAALDGADFDVEKLADDLQRDRAQLSRLLASIEAIAPQDDPKLIMLVEELVHLGAEQGDRRKLLVFTSFTDTVEYIRETIDREVLSDPRLGFLRGRVAYVDARSLSPDERAEVAVGFTPRSMRPDDLSIADRFDVLITTDVLAEGQNLQQCGRLINFDLPWNPMRIVQRNGRIDRLGSPHDTIEIGCFMPDRQLDEILRLEERLQRKIVQANAAVGPEGEVIPGSRHVERVFADDADAIRRLAEGDATVLDELERQADLSGEDFREELRSLLLDRAAEDVEALPWGVGSGHAELPTAETASVTFLARVAGRYLLRSVPIDSAGGVSTDLLSALRVARCTFDAERHLPDEVRPHIYDLWRMVQQSIAREYERRRDPVQSRVELPKVQRDAVDLLLQVGTTESFGAAQILSSGPWPIDVGRTVRAILKDESTSRDEKAERLQVAVQERGLRASVAEEVPHITMDDVHLVCFQYSVPGVAN